MTVPKQRVLGCLLGTIEGRTFDLVYVPENGWRRVWVRLAAVCDDNGVGSVSGGERAVKTSTEGSSGRSSFAALPERVGSGLYEEDVGVKATKKRIDACVFGMDVVVHKPQQLPRNISTTLHTQ